MRSRFLCLGAVVAAVAAGEAKACDMHGDFGYELAAFYRGGLAPGPAAMEAEAARQQAEDLAMAEARAAFLTRYAITPEAAPARLAQSTPAPQSSDADRRPQSRPSDR